MAAGLLAFAVVASACGGNDGASTKDADDEQAEKLEEVTANTLEEETEARDGGGIVVAVNSETNGWNPGPSQWADAGNLVGSSVLEPLMAFDETGAVVPYLATDMKPNAENTEWTITLPTGVEFHDGTPLTAETVAADIDFQAHGPTLVKVAFDKVVGKPEVVDATTVRVPMLTPWAAFDAAMAGPAGYIIADSMRDEANQYGNDNPVGTGPFEFQSWVPDESFVVTRFDNYRIEGQPHLDKIEFRVQTDSTARSAALRAGDVDLILTTQSASIQEFAGDPAYTVISDLESEEKFVQLNTAEPPFDNINARKALAYGTDREALADLLGEGLAEVSDDPLDGRWSVEEPGYVDYDPQKAEEALEAYEEETGAPLTFTLSGIPNPDERLLMDALKQQWTELGIDVDISQVEQTVFITDAVGGNYQAQSFRSYGYADPDSDYYFWHSVTVDEPIAINFTRWKDTVIDENLQIGRESTDFDTRKAAYDKVIQELNASFTHIWLFDTPYAVIADANVRGLNRARQVPFANFLPKLWWGEVWLESAD